MRSNSESAFFISGIRRGEGAISPQIPSEAKNIRRLNSLAPRMSLKSGEALSAAKPKKKEQAFCLFFLFGAGDEIRTR